MQPRQRFAQRRAMTGGWSPDPHAVEEGDHGGRPAGDLAQHLSAFVLHRLRAGDAARVQMLHQRQKERQILGRDTLLVKREDEIAAAGMNEKIRILDALGNALIGEQLPDVVTGEKGSKVFRHHVGVDGHCDPSCAFRVPGDRVQRPVIGNMGSSAVDLKFLSL